MITKERNNLQSTFTCNSFQWFALTLIKLTSIVSTCNRIPCRFYTNMLTYNMWVYEHAYWDGWVHCIILIRTIADGDWCFDKLWSTHLQSTSKLYFVSWWYWTLNYWPHWSIKSGVDAHLSVRLWHYILAVKFWNVSFCVFVSSI